MNSFLTNTIWYIALAATSVLTLTVIYLKARESKKVFAFWFAVLGLTYCIEISLLLLFKAYTYYPMIKPDDPFFDAILGNIFSQVSVSSSAVLICLFGLSNWWLAGFSAVYFLIDVLFVNLGIYVHYWYRSIFTLGGFFIYGLIIKYWYKRMFNDAPKWIAYPTLFLSVWSIFSNISGTSLRLFDLRVLNSSFYPDPSRSHTSAALIYGSVMAVIMISLHRWKTSWRLKSFVCLLLFVCQWGLLQSGVMVVNSGWGIAIPLFDLAVLYGMAVMMDRCLLNNSKPLLTPGSKGGRTCSE